MPESKSIINLDFLYFFKKLKSRLSVTDIWRTLFVFVLFISTKTLNGQNLSGFVDFGFASTHAINTELWGLHFEAKKCLGKKKILATGGSFSTFFNRVTKPSYGYNISKPVIGELEAGWINQFSIVREKSLWVALNFNAGFSDIDLGDRAQQVPIKDSFFTTAKLYASDYGLMLEPGIDLSIKMKSNWLTTKLKYRINCLENSHFSSTQQTFGIWFAICFSWIG